MRKITLPSYYLFLLPLLALLVVVGMMYYRPLDSTLAIGITLDLVVTIPCLYLLAIHYQNIPKRTVVPVVLLGVLLGSWMLPVEQQVYLNYIKNYVLPVVELGVLSFIVYKVYQTKQLYQQGEERDFYSRLLQVTKALFPERVSHFLAAELSVPYYCFWVWKTPRLTDQEFAYHQKSGSVALLGAFFMLLMVETFALHLLIQLWSPLVAWILTGLSGYSLLQLISLMKSMAQRPIILTADQLHLKYGTLGELLTTVENIQQVTPYERLQHDDFLPRLAALGRLETPNVYLEFKRPVVLVGAFGKVQEVTRLLLFVDEQEAFIERLHDFLT
ncbi:MAG: hypothetical protein ACRBFS_18775 [Aureispira sp.]